MMLRKLGIDGERQHNERGVALVELALLLPLLVVLAFGVIDLGRLIHARLVVTNVSREGGSLASRDIQVGDALITMLQSSATPFNLQTQGRIHVIKIKAGETRSDPLPYIDSRVSRGSYTAASSSISGNVNDTPGGLSSTLMNHLTFKTSINTSELSEINIVEVFYHYRPITPLPNFVLGLFPTDGGILIGSRAIF
jgi:Flp pilus assembly protein TadG